MSGALVYLSSVLQGIRLEVGIVSGRVRSDPLAFPLPVFDLLARPLPLVCCVVKPPKAPTRSAKPVPDGELHDTLPEAQGALGQE